MAEWLYETGIGEARAALIEDGHIVEAHIEAESTAPRAGAIVSGRLSQILVAGRRAITTLSDGTELLVEPPPPGLTEGASLPLEITREAIPEPGKPKRAKARAAEAGTPPREGPDLATRIAASGLPCRTLGPHDPDALEAVGWSEMLESAASGEVEFSGGSLRISLAPAMTLIDIDGMLDLASLAIAGTTAAGAAIRRFGIGGSIGIDLPTVASKAERHAAAEAFDAALPPPFERTAINGFGFMQVIRPRPRASLPELLQYDSAAAQARALLRRAQRSGLVGAATLVAPPTVTRILEAHPGWLDTLARQLGGPVALHTDATLAISACYAAKAP